MSQLLKQKELYEWLNSLDLSYHFDRFIENGYEDVDVCKDIGESDLQAIGIFDIHERIALLQAVRFLRQQLVQKNTVNPPAVGQSFGSIFSSKRKQKESPVEPCPGSGSKSNGIVNGGNSSGVSSNNSTSTSSSSCGSYYSYLHHQGHNQNPNNIIRSSNNAFKSGCRVQSSNTSANNYEECDSIVLDRDYNCYLTNTEHDDERSGRRDHFYLVEEDEDEPLYEIVSPIPPSSSQNQNQNPSSILHQIYHEPLDSELVFMNQNHSSFSQSNPNLLWTMNGSGSTSQQHHQHHPLTPSRTSHSRQKQNMSRLQEQQAVAARLPHYNNNPSMIQQQQQQIEHQKFNLQRANLILRTAELQDQLRQQKHHHHQQQHHHLEEINNISRTCDESTNGPNTSSTVQYASELSSDNVLPPHSLVLQFPLLPPPRLPNGFQTADSSSPATTTTIPASTLTNNSAFGLYSSVDHLYNFDYCLEPEQQQQQQQEVELGQQRQLNGLWLGERRRLSPNGACTRSTSTSCSTTQSPGSKKMAHHNLKNNSSSSSSNYLLPGHHKNKCKNAATCNSTTRSSSDSVKINSNGGHTIAGSGSSTTASAEIPTVSGLVAAAAGVHNGHHVPASLMSMSMSSSCTMTPHRHYRQHHHGQSDSTNSNTMNSKAKLNSSHCNKNNSKSHGNVNEELTINSGMNSLLISSPEHAAVQQRHQYLQHVIITNNNSNNNSSCATNSNHNGTFSACTNSINSGSCNNNNSFGSSRITAAPSSFAHPLSSPTRAQQTYTPGIYSPSSCLLDKDEIYDYAPPLQRKYGKQQQQYYSSPSKRSLQNSLSPFKSKGGKCKSTLSCYGGESTSIGKSNSPKRKYATIKNSSKFSYALSRSMSLYGTGAAQSTCSSAPTYVNTCSIESGAGEDESCTASPANTGCRTLTNLSKRLGLARIFRTLRLHGNSNSRHSESIEIVLKPRKGNFGNGKLIENVESELGTGTASHQSKSAAERSQNLACSKSAQEPSCTSLSSLSLPSNERIIETINRLKYEELQKRKERIAQEHLNWSSENLPVAQQSTTENHQEKTETPKKLSKKVKSSKKSHRESSTDDNGAGVDDENEIGQLTEPDLSNPPSSASASPTKSSSFMGKVKERSKKLRRFSLKNNKSESVESNSQSSSVPSTAGDGRNSAFFENDNPIFNDIGDERYFEQFNKLQSKAIDIVRSNDNHISEEDEGLLTSLNSNSTGHGQLGSLTLSETEEYTGPFVGKAVALVDCTPSPYDRHALRYKKGDIIEIISKKPTGIWTGKVNGQVGHFKFINIEILPAAALVSDEDELDSISSHDDPNGDSYSNYSTSNNVRRRIKRNTPLTQWEMEQRQTVANVINGIRKENAALLINSHSSSSLVDNDPSSSSQFQVQNNVGNSAAAPTPTSMPGRRRSSTVVRKGRPKSVGDLLRRINLEEHISVFILHGFESLDLFKELEEEDLNRLAIMNPSDRGKLLTAVELLREFDTEEEIPPIIIPTYSSTSSSPFGVQDDDGTGKNNTASEYNYQLHNNIITPPPNFTRTTGKIVRDSGVFVKCDDDDNGAREPDEDEDDRQGHDYMDLDVDEIILSPANLRTTSQALVNRVGTKKSEMSKISDNENVKVNSVRQRFLNAKLLFESSPSPPAESKRNSSSSGVGVVGLDGHVPAPAAMTSSKSPRDDKANARFLYCEKSSDSGISVGASSPTRIDL